MIQEGHNNPYKRDEESSFESYVDWIDQEQYCKQLDEKFRKEIEIKMK